MTADLNEMIDSSARESFKLWKVEQDEQEADQLRFTPGGNGDHAEDDDSDAGQNPDDPDDGLPIALDWHEAFARDSDIEWLVDDIWPARRQLQIFAAKKTGKSLVMLWIVINLAAGRDPFTGQAIPPRNVCYLDYEMSPDDLVERLEDMGHGPDDIPANFRYYLLPLLPPFDTAEGGRTLMRLVERDQADVVVFDTLSRVVEGEENSNDTYQNLYAYTGLRLKKAGVALARLDHEGHEGGRARGASAKADDVDINWRLERTDDGYRFTNKGARVAYVPAHVDIRQGADPLTFTRIGDSWPAGTKAKADELDTIGAPLDLTFRAARTLLKAVGCTPGTNAVLSKAIAYRKHRTVVL